MTIAKRIAENPPFINTDSKPMQSLLFSDIEACAYLGNSVSVSSLRKARSEGTIGGRTPAPPFVRIGGRVFYRREDLDKWVASLRAQVAV